MTTPIRVLHAIETPGTGGAERVLVDVARSLSPDFHSVGMTLVEGWTADELRSQHIENHVLALKRSFDLSWPVRFARFLRRNAIDVVHCHEFTTTCYAALGCALASVPLVSTMHGKNYWPHRAYRRRALSWAARSSHAFVAVSEDLKRFMMEVLKLPSDVVRVVRNGIDLARFTPNTVHGEAVRASLDAAADDVVIVSVGALEPVKGHRLLIEAMAELHRTQPTVKLWLVGEGYLRGELEAQATQLGLQRVVSFLGWRTDVPAVLAAADFSVLASQSEGMPLAAMESMACGRPVVATRVGGLGELIESGVSGVLIAPGNLEELVSALRGLVENAEQRSMLGAAANQRAVEQFSVQAMQASYEAIYRRAITR